MRIKSGIIGVLLLWCIMANAAPKSYVLKSPDGKLVMEITVDKDIRYRMSHDGQQILAPSAIAMTLGDGVVLGKEAQVTGKEQRTAEEKITAPFYRFKEITTAYNELNLKFKGHYGILFRAYNEGGAYRFYTALKGDIDVVNELAEFNFDKDYNSYLPYSPSPKNPMCMSFQNFYQKVPLTQFDVKNLAFLPAVVELDNGKKLTVTEADLEAYPGMFIKSEGNETAFHGTFAAFPTQTWNHPGRCQQLVKERASYMAKVKGTRSFPWRVLVVTTEDTQMPVNNLVYALASPNRIGDYSWVKPGKIAWDWWNDWGVYGVDFKVGINTATYKYYIDFAAENKLEYVVLDEGWSDPKKGDIMSVIPEIDLPVLVEYARQKGVGLFLWVVGNVLDDKREEACRYYSQLGIKGFKIDFVDRDDQKAVELIYRLTETAANHRLMVDWHGVYKPTGLNRTYPNAINFEGVYGLEELKWSNPDMPLYDVTMPYIRMLAGSVDYTQGAMKNANKRDFRSIHNNPMSQGTRCHQLATYIVFDAPLVTLCDAPTAYRQNQECTDFIVGLPVVADETRILQGTLGEYIVSARKSGDHWYVGGLANWDPREVELNLSFLPAGTYTAEIFRDGVNAARRGEDYIREVKDVTNAEALKLAMAPGGGFAIRFSKK